MPEAGKSFIAKVVADPEHPPELMRLSGYRGASSEKGHIRLYGNSELSLYWDIPEKDVLHEEAVPKETDPLGSVTLWVKRDSKIISHAGAGQPAVAPEAGAAPLPTPTIHYTPTINPTIHFTPLPVCHTPVIRCFPSPVCPSVEILCTRPTTVISPYCPPTHTPPTTITPTNTVAPTTIDPGTFAQAAPQAAAAQLHLPTPTIHFTPACHTPVVHCISPLCPVHTPVVRCFPSPVQLYCTYPTTVVSPNCTITPTTYTPTTVGPTTIETGGTFAQAAPQGAPMAAQAAFRPTQIQSQFVVCVPHSLHVFCTRPSPFCPPSVEILCPPSLHFPCVTHQFPCTPVTPVSPLCTPGHTVTATATVTTVETGPQAAAFAQAAPQALTHTIQPTPSVLHHCTVSPVPHCPPSPLVVCNLHTPVIPCPPPHTVFCTFTPPTYTPQTVTATYGGGY